MKEGNRKEKEMGPRECVEHPTRSLGSRWPAPKFSIFFPRPRAWQGHGVPGPPQQPVKLIAVPRRVGLEGLYGIPCASCLRGLDMLNATRAPRGTGSFFDESAGQFGCDSPTRTARKTVRSWSGPLATNRTRRLQRSTITAHPNHAASRAVRL